MENEAMFTITNDGKLELYKEPYATIECETEEDYNSLLKAVEDNWIPVSEKLPDKVGWYLVTNDEYKVDLGHWFFNEGWKEGSNSKTIAWKPLPQPYKED